MSVKSGHGITCEKWGVVNNKTVLLFTIQQEDGSLIQLTNYGAIIVSIIVPDRKGHLDNVVVGFPDLQGYLQDECYIGATIGRFANRIAHASFTLEEKQYFLQANDHSNSNHSADSGFNTRIFDYSIDENQLIFTLLSADGEGGFPGNLALSVQYEWSESHELKISYKATTDKKTIANFTNHTYFNLSAQKDILLHQLSIESDKTLETDKYDIPTGKIVDAANKTFHKDKLGEKLGIKNEDRVQATEWTINGLNDCYVLPNKDHHTKTSVPVCTLLDQAAGRQLDVFTSYPGLLVYTGDYLHSTAIGHQGKAYEPFNGLCLECQYYPDSPNHPSFPSTILEVGETYKEFIIYKFSTLQNLQNDA